MTSTSTTWNTSDLSHRFTASFFRSSYGDTPSFVMGDKDRKNNELNYFNIADYDNETEAQICAGLLVAYMENQGIPYHDGKKRGKCFEALSEHLKKADGKVLVTADVVDEYFKFLGE
jgi:hypothetical protein